MSYEARQLDVGRIEIRCTSGRTMHQRQGFGLRTGDRIRPGFASSGRAARSKPPIRGPRAERGCTARKLLIGGKCGPKRATPTYQPNNGVSLRVMPFGSGERRPEVRKVV